MKKMSFYASPGAHEVTPVMINAYLDWLDIRFGRKQTGFNDELIYTYSFDEWEKMQGREPEPDEYAEIGMNDILTKADGKMIRTKDEWEEKTLHLKKQINSIIGELPEYEKIQTITFENERKFKERFLKAEVRINDQTYSSPDISRR